MKITTEDGTEFELVLDKKNSTLNKDSYVYNLKPVKKTEKTSAHKIELWEAAGETIKVWNIDLTPTTANKLSEAISALVEYVTDEGVVFRKNDRTLLLAAEQARKSFQESQ